MLSFVLFLFSTQNQESKIIIQTINITKYHFKNFSIVIRVAKQFSDREQRCNRYKAAFWEKMRKKASELTNCKKLTKWNFYVYRKLDLINWKPDEEKNCRFIKSIAPNLSGCNYADKKNQTLLGREKMWRPFFIKLYNELQFSNLI